MCAIIKPGQENSVRITFLIIQLQDDGRLQGESEDGERKLTLRTSFRRLSLVTLDNLILLSTSACFVVVVCYGFFE